MAASTTFMDDKMNGCPVKLEEKIISTHWYCILIRDAFNTNISNFITKLSPIFKKEDILSSKEDKGLKLSTSKVRWLDKEVGVSLSIVLI